ncbi:histidine kinase [Sphingomonas sp. Leaf357]|uniref:sensor histidine kinase n=1 Tax=Sphingomonas sp. Leaf357 TaxID=1736350 RepID=UPI0006F9FC0C|nr:sensor histidine kinase [Sphingomonas sp. Leaf357]KQS03070.1 histidine kinase [Sphingomonas sp. Leaf357]
MAQPFLQRLGVREGLARRFLIACMAIGFAALIVAVAAAAWSTSRTTDHGRWVAHTYEVELAVTRVANVIEQSETVRRGYLLSGQQVYLDSYREIAAKLDPALDVVEKLTIDNPRQRRFSAQLRDMVRAIVAHRDETIALVRAGRRPAAIESFVAETSAARMKGIRETLAAMGAEERRLLTIRDRELQASVRVFYIILGVAGLLLLFVACASLATVLRYTRELATSRDTLRDFADSLEEQVTERTADLSRANEEIQRFAYIVSHDLRSPLVNVMGFTAELDTATAAITELIDRAEAQAPEIVSEDARLAAREDLPEAIRFIRTSTQKMDRLINAILKLSREGRRVIAPEPVDMAGLVGTIDASLKHLTEDRGATIGIDGELPGIVTDRLAIEQIFSNLIENAVKYLQPGRPGRILVRGARNGSRIAYEIEDNGRGIAETDHQRVFDLFRRSGHQDQPGEGIGLAHVRALVYRLGGVIDVRSELGKGATFRVTLPATLTEVEFRRSGEMT